MCLVTTTRFKQVEIVNHYLQTNVEASCSRKNTKGVLLDSDNVKNEVSDKDSKITYLISTLLLLAYFNKTADLRVM